MVRGKGKAWALVLALTGLASVAVGLGVARPVLAAPQVAIELKDGQSLRADRVYFTFTDLVVLEGSSLRTIPNGLIKSVDGRPLAEAARMVQLGQGQAVSEVPASASNPLGQPAAWPLGVGMQRIYELDSARTTWLRRGRQMNRQGTSYKRGLVEESTLPAGAGAWVPPGSGPTLYESIWDSRQAGARRTRVAHRISVRPEGYFLVGQGMEDPMLKAPLISDRISPAPMIWPSRFEVGQSWAVGPFTRLGLSQSGRMQVVDRESVEVPAGSFAEAFKVVGYGHVYAGTQELRGGRLVTDHGSVETTTWFVPGLGPVREQAKLHLHQHYFPQGGQEVPLVVEEESTRRLKAYRPGT